MKNDSLSLDLFDERSQDREAVEPGTPASPSAGSAQDDVLGETTVWTVSQVNRAVRKLLEGSLPPLWVSGEVGGWKRARSGHCYFTLKDERAQLRCVLFRTDAQRLPTDPEDGMEVRVLGSLTLYEGRGEYQLVARRLDGLGDEGLWRLAFEKLKTKLESEGLLDPLRKRRIPRFPTRVGVVTSTTGAALRDILTVLKERAPWLTVIVRDAPVQGEGASQAIAYAIRHLVSRGSVDVVLVGRGGGSVEDLWAFNEEPVARAIAECPVPVISAVGHEVDVTMADLVADLRAPTPSGAAEAVAQDGAALLGSLQALPSRLGGALRRALHRSRLGLAGRELRMRDGLERLLTPRRQWIDRGVIGLERAMRDALRSRRRRCEALTGRLEALSPLATLARGYAVPTGAGGRLLRGTRDFEPGVPFTLRLSDGQIGCETVSTSRDENPPR